MLLAPLLLPTPALADPATDADFRLYTRLAALNICVMRAAGIEFDRAVAIAGETISLVLQGQHGGMIVQMGPKPLARDELRKGSSNSAVIDAVEICPDNVPADVVKNVRGLIKQQSGGKPAPAPAAK
ncbi:cAMP phosphodiesterase [Cyanobium sp. ATX 6F1]|uniref:cAMP phosphodiesterase n=1 Tax=unclassified Cyanobium TaxID=2627006 RepID=UPI0020CBF23C|nr:cAMP phosphodiesterase [Cyanobium sp. ATX 6F1]